MRLFDFAHGSSGRTSARTEDTLSLSKSLNKALEEVRAVEDPIVQMSRFGLADQVLTHTLMQSGLSFELYPVAGTHKASLIEITSERYDLVLREGLHPEAFVVDAQKLLGDADHAQLVQYILDHEVPVDPDDIIADDFYRLAS